MREADNYIKKLIAEGEHQQLDFKFEISDAKKIARSLVAFANTDGGHLLIGVKDNGVIAGVRSEEEVYMVETASHLYCKPEVKFKTKNHIVNNKIVVEIIVLPSSNKPHFAPGKNDKLTAYIRVNDENKIANNVIVKVWKRQTQPNGVYLKFTDTEKKILTFMEKYGELSFSKTCRIAKVNKNRVENILANFISVGIVEPVFYNKRVGYKIKT